MNKQQSPYKTMIFVCTNSREPGQRISCAGAGRCGEKILVQLKEHIKKKGLDNEFRIAKSGCQDRCELGPIISVFPHQDMLTHVDESDVPVIIQSYLSDH